jgi:hypothetical protein
LTSIRRAFVTVGLASAMVVAAFSSAMPQFSSKLLDDPTPFEIGYGMSFYDFDACGDSEAGRIFRRAIIEKFDLCPFSPQARAKFEQWRTEALEDLLSDCCRTRMKSP